MEVSKWHREWLTHGVLLDRKMGGGECVRGEVATGGWATWSEHMSVGFTSLIIDPSCEFLGAAGGMKKEHRSVETDEEGLTAARRKRISTCRLVHLREDYILRLCSCLAMA